MAKTQNINLVTGIMYQFEYTNHRGVTAMRKAVYVNFQIIGKGHEDYYPAGTLCLLMKAVDRNGAYRSFALSNINFDTFRSTAL